MTLWDLIGKLPPIVVVIYLFLTTLAIGTAIVLTLGLAQWMGLIP